MVEIARVETVAGVIHVEVDDQGSVTRCEFASTKLELTSEGERVARVAKQLREYFAGERKTFDVHLRPKGTDFQRRVWEALRQIPFGETISYAELAKRIGSPRAVRAVGQANGANPIAVIVPCHRVIGADGSLAGYSAGTERKRDLLRLEGIDVTQQGKCFRRQLAARG